MTVYLGTRLQSQGVPVVLKQYQNIYSKEIFMIYAGIDVAKTNTTVLLPIQLVKYYSNLSPFLTIVRAFETLFQKIQSVSDDLTKVKVDWKPLDITVIIFLGILLDKGLPTFVINPLHTNLIEKSLSLRKTKTDKVDAHTIASTSHV